MYENLKIALAKVSKEGIIYQRYEFEEKTLCFSSYNPETKKHSVSPDLDSPFVELKNFSELQQMLFKIDKKLTKHSDG